MNMGSIRVRMSVKIRKRSNPIIAGEDHMKPA